MLTDEIRTFLQKPLIARMTTIGGDGYPHTVPVWFVVDGEDIVTTSVRQTQKVKHIGKNARGAMEIGGDAGDGGGYLFEGDFAIEEEPDDQWTKVLCYRYDPPEQAEKNIEAWKDLDMIVIRLTVGRVLKVA